MTPATTFLIDCIKHELKQPHSHDVKVKLMVELMRLERELAAAEDGDP